MDIAENYSTLTTIGGWTVIIVLGVVAWYQTTNKNRRAATPKPANARNDPATETKKKADRAARHKSKPKAPASNSPAATEPAVSYDWEDEQAADKKADREFARQLATTHAGTTFNTKKADEKRQKSVKQSKAQEKENATGKTSAPSSTTGDADDDMSPQNSPDGRDVSDMLEAAAPGPSAIRLTNTDTADKPKQRKVKAAEPVKGKNHQKNRKKREEEAAEKKKHNEQQAKLGMDQRRTAREAEGRPAKDGSTFMAAANAWKDKPTSGGEYVQPLDTAEQSTKPESVKASTPTPAPATKAAPVSWADADFPSEERQMEMVRDAEDWSEVKTKKSRKRKDNSTEPASTPSANNGNSAAPAANAKARAPVNGTRKPILNSSSSSFAALTPDETDDNEEAEQEWDV
ncbi:hypothetical protein F4780DRAFT_338370 [Xylariomycetidae sp. FL0641]|nr:hypothetical protein F4780DRAFT_338370 [Xylariomycetidae sp. FL0641]